jgi:hypothetical protein
MPSRRRASSLLVVSVMTAAVFAAACHEVGFAPDQPASIAFERRSIPAVVVGDVMRDTLGDSIPLRAIVYNGHGDVIPNAPVRFVYADTDRALQVDSVTGYVRALKGRALAGRIAARIGTSLQIIDTIPIASQPDSLASSQDSVATLFYVADARSYPSDIVGVRLLHDTAGGPTGVRGMIVRYDVLSPLVSGNDTTGIVFLTTPDARPSAIDTTDASGTAARVVRVRPALFGGTPPTQIVVRATVLYPVRQIRNNPISFTIPLKSKPATTP